MALEVRYVGHTYGCHPETCACNVYAITTEKGSVVSNFYDEKTAKAALEEIQIQHGNEQAAAKKRLAELQTILKDALQEAQEVANKAGLSFHFRDEEFLSHAEILRQIEDNYLDDYYASSTKGAWVSSSDYC